MTRHLVVAAFLGIFAGCSWGLPADATAAQGLDRGATLKGTDANANGVRDDIEVVIVRDYTGSQVAAAMQTAKAFQKAVVVDATDKPALRGVNHEISLGINCLFSTFAGGNISKNPAQVAQELESLTTNTKPRMLAYLRYNKALDGTVSSLPEGNTCEN